MTYGSTRSTRSATGTAVLGKITRPSRVGWLFLVVAFASLMVIGSQRDSSPATPQERVEAVARKLACPTCDGETVAESRGAASQAIRREITRLVGEGRLSDDEIVTSIDDSYAESLRVTPGSTGLESVVWILPVAAAVSAITALVFAFRRWRMRSSNSSVRADEAADSDAARDERSSKLRSIVAVALVVLIAVAAGVTVARNSGDRRPGQGMTGGTGEMSISALLAQARSLGMGDTENALDLYSRVLEQEPANVEALTYFGWLTVLSASGIQDSEQAAQRLESGLVLLRQATIVDDSYPDAHCFLGISFFRFLGDASAAAPEIDTCLASNPPSEVAVLVEGLSQKITDALAGAQDAPNADTTDSIPD